MYPTPTTPAPRDSGGPMSLAEAAAYLGISDHTLRRWVQLRQIEFIRVGRLTKFRQAALDRHLAAHTVAPSVKRSR